MPLVVRRVKVQDLSILEALEGESVRSFPSRKHSPVLSGSRTPRLGGVHFEK